MKCSFILLVLLLMFLKTHCRQMKGVENNKKYTYPKKSTKELNKKYNASTITTQIMNATTQKITSERKNEKVKVASTTPMTSLKQSNKNQDIEETGDILATISKMPFFQKLFSKTPETPTKQYFIPVLVVADRSFMNFHKNTDYEDYIKNAMNMVSEYFHDSSLGVNVSVSVSRNMYVEKESDVFHNETAFGVLNNFCDWTNKTRSSDNYYYDLHHVAILITRQELVGKGNRSVHGATYTASACLPEKACIVVQDRGLLLGVNIAHLLGHLLGALDDEDKEIPSNLVFRSIMLSPVKHDRISWSDSSRLAIGKFFSDGLGKCLEEQPSSMKRHPNMLAGAAYNADMQCQLLHKTPKACYLNTEHFCKQLFCEQQNGSCISSGTQPAQGTSCGIDRWCFNTECVHLGYRPGAVNGGWDEWQEWSPCSRTCGGGVKMSRRACSRPAPARGGRHCVGSAYRANSCNTQACPLIQPSYRAVQCANLFGQGVTVEHRGRVSGCTLHCSKSDNGRVVRMQARAADGTPCRPGTNDMCVKGACMRVGCDWVLGSSVTEDRCGVCGGDGNGCELVYLHHNMSGPLHRDNTVFVGTIPRWSTRVKIYETKPSANHLALSVSHSRQNIKQYLVGGNNQTVYGEFNVGRLTGYYTHLLDDQDYVMIKGPLPFDVNVYQVAVSKELVPVHYSYMALNKLPRVSSYARSFPKSKSSNNEWEYLEWSICSARCEGGYERSRARCVSPHAGVVADRFCDETRRPRDQIRVCNLNYCPTRWKVGPWHLVGKSRLRTVVCMRERKQWQSSPQLAKDSLCTAPKPPTVITYRSSNKKSQPHNVTTPPSLLVKTRKTATVKDTKLTQCDEVHKTSKNVSHQQTNTSTKPTRTQHAHIKYNFKPTHRKGSKSTHVPSYTKKEVIYKKPVIQIFTAVTGFKALIKPKYETAAKSKTTNKPVKQIKPPRPKKYDIQFAVNRKQMRSLLDKQNMLLNYKKYFTILAIYDEGHKGNTNSEISTHIPFVNNTLKTWKLDNWQRNFDYSEVRTSHEATHVTESYNLFNTIERNVAVQEYGENTTEITNLDYDILDNPYENETITDKYMIIKLFTTDKSINNHDSDYSQILNATTSNFDFDKLKSNKGQQSINYHLDINDIKKQATTDINVTQKLKLVNGTTKILQSTIESSEEALNKSKNLIYKSLIDYIIDNHLIFSNIENDFISITEPTTYDNMGIFSNENDLIDNYNDKLTQTTSVYDKNIHSENTAYETTNLNEEDEAAISYVQNVKNVSTTKPETRTYEIDAQNYKENKIRNKQKIDKKLLDIINKFDTLKIAILKRKKEMTAKKLKNQKRKRRFCKHKRDDENVPFIKHLREDPSELDVIDVVENIKFFNKIKDKNEQQLSYELYLLQKDNIYIVLVKPVQLNVSDQLYIIVKTLLGHTDYKKLSGLPESQIIFGKTLYKVINKSLNRFDADAMLTKVLKDIVRAKLNINKNNKISHKGNTSKQFPHDTHKLSYKNIPYLVSVIKDRNTHKWDEVMRKLNLCPSKKREGFMYTYFDFYKLKQLQNVFYLEQKGNKRKYNAYIILELLNDNNIKPLIGLRERMVYNKNVFEIKNVKQVVNIDNVINTLIKLSMIDNESEINRKIRDERNKRPTTGKMTNINFSPKVQNFDVLNNVNVFLRKGYRNISQVNPDNKNRIKRHYRYQNGKGFRHRPRKNILQKTTTPNITTTVSPAITDVTSTVQSTVSDTSASHHGLNTTVHITLKPEQNCSKDNKVTDAINTLKYVRNIIEKSSPPDKKMNNALLKNKQSCFIKSETIDLKGNDRYCYIEDYVPVEDETIVAADVSPNDAFNDLSDNAYRAVGGDLPMTYKMSRPKV